MSEIIVTDSSAVWIAIPPDERFPEGEISNELSAQWFVSKYRRADNIGKVVFLDVRAERIHEAFGAIKSLISHPEPSTFALRVVSH